MTESERREHRSRVNAALRESCRMFFHRKALLGDDVVVSDAEGNVVQMSASRYLELHPEMRMSDEEWREARRRCRSFQGDDAP